MHSARRHLPCRLPPRSKVRTVDYLGDRDLAQRSGVNCPKCGARTQGGKFCADCGAPLAPKRTCAGCGAVSDGTPKFCPEYGQPFGG